MKKLILIAFVTGLSLSAAAQNTHPVGVLENKQPIAQTKPVTPLIAKDTAKYARFIKVPENVYSRLLIFTQAYKENVIYNSLMDDKTVRQEQFNINSFMSNIDKMVALDSVKIGK